MGQDTASGIMDWAALAGIVEFPMDSSVPRLGSFEAGDAARLFGASKRAMRPEPHVIDGWSGVVFGDFYAAFDEGGKLQVLNYGFRPGDLLSDAVLEAVSGVEETGARSSSGGGLRMNDTAEVGLAGRRLDAFATLPRFAALLGASGALHLSGRGSDKFIRVSIRGPSAVLAADFLLKAFKAPETEAFSIDYCLYGLSLVGHKAEAAFNNAANERELP